jgi:hypothetical protein
MTDDDDFGSAGYDRLTTLLASVISAIHDRPADALMLMKEAYARADRCPEVSANACKTLNHRLKVSSDRR